jgi:uncharacterized membrane protein HdeD (DUF308 family)
MTAATAPMSMETQQRPWWLTLIGGIMVLVIGAVLLWAPAKTQANTWVLLIQLLGIYWLVGGILELVHMFTDHSGWGWKLFMGIVSIMAGSYILMYPIASAVMLPMIFVLVLGVWGFVQGCILLFMAFKGGGWGAGILGVLGIIFGLILMGNYYMPTMGLTMIWLAAVTAVVGGIAMIFMSFQQRKLNAG